MQRHKQNSDLRFLIVYFERWQLTNIGYLVKNIVSSGLVFLLTCYAVRDNSFIYMEATKSCLFAVLMCAIWSGLFNSIAMFYNEADYTMDDLEKVLPTRIYVIANALIQAFLCLAESVVCVVIFQMFFDYNSEGVVTPLMNIDFIITFFLVMFSADMLGFAVGLLVNNITTAMTMIPIVLIAQFLFSGCLFDLDGIMKFGSRFTTARWGYSALGSLTNLNHMKSRISDQIMGYKAPKSELFEMTKSFVDVCWINLGVLAIVGIAAAGLLLVWKTYKE